MATEQEIKIRDATLQLEAAMNLAGMSYERRSEYTYVDFGSQGYARFSILPARIGLGAGEVRPVIVALELQPAGKKKTKRTVAVAVKGYPQNVIKAIRKVAGGVQ